ncbi:2,3-butanediol dehydrogenase [Corynebacterium lubricantis]|uniref:2,3-butanediol dehydrogenase n=1 Tax=Corynebacterium lubricantis TaxID=541095 RepID=UPI0003617D0B|nr:2,3-butanediol dehydrogenase [Corynebacterium lubricantis]
MRAARYYGNKDIRIEEIDEPTAGPGQVLIKVAWCGICGTDLHEYLEGPIFTPPHGHPHPISGEENPVTLGHEMSGTIEALGEGVTDLEVGQKVVVEPYIIHDDVDEKTDPHYNLSPDMNFIGLAGRGGGLSEKIAVERRWVHPIADHVELDEAALIEPLSVGHNAFKASGAKEGDVAFIGGLGPIGLLTAAVLKAYGLTVVATETSSLRREKAVETGVVDHALDPTQVDVVEEVKKLTDGVGADVAFECTSVNVVLDQLVEALKPAGTLVIESIWSKKAELDVHAVVMKQLTITGIIGYAHDHPETIKLVEEGKVDLKPFITGKIGLDGLINEGFDTLINHNETAVKILVSPDL